MARLERVGEPGTPVVFDLLNDCDNANHKQCETAKPWVNDDGPTWLVCCCACHATVEYKPVIPEAEPEAPRPWAVREALRHIERVRSVMLVEAVTGDGLPSDSDDVMRLDHLSFAAGLLTGFLSVIDPGGGDEFEHPELEPDEPEADE